jgi:hypothetical protein
VQSDLSCVSRPTTSEVVVNGAFAMRLCREIVSVSNDSCQKRHKKVVYPRPQLLIAFRREAAQE